MNTERLLRLAEFLETEGEEIESAGAWDFDVWAKRESSVAGTLGDCGTAGCALGYCSVVFPGEVTLKWENCSAEIMFTGTFLENLQGAQYFFALHEEGTRFLFLKNCYDSEPSPNDVANRIRKLIQAHNE